MTYSGIAFQGDWPEMLRAEVEDLILQHDQEVDPPPENTAPDEAPYEQYPNEQGGECKGPLHRLESALYDRTSGSDQSMSSEDSTRKRFRKEGASHRMPTGSGKNGEAAHRDEDGETTGPWIAQHNPSPTGPLYAVGRTARDGRDALGPILCGSGKALLDKLRDVLNAHKD
jgi:hypothetical protein